jgi:SAM-dependent methyltransferase
MSKLARSIGRRIIGLDSRLKRAAIEFMDRRALNNYLKSDRRPWRYGYSVYRNKYLADVIRDASILETFHQTRALPAGYGFRLDARVVEIPWVLGHVEKRTGRLLDAGSSLNFDFVLMSSSLANKKVTIVTLAPEATCFWRLCVSYVFGDLRILDFRDEWFDTIACISTIEHVGMDNRMYSGAADLARRGEPRDFILAVKELKRVLKPGGVLYMTFPFGEYENHGWFQQFDSELVDMLVEGFSPGHFNETVFRYEPEGWKLSDRASCAHCQFFDVHISKYFDPNSTIEYPSDYPAGERAVACLELFK